MTITHHRVTELLVPWLKPIVTDWPCLSGTYRLLMLLSLWLSLSLVPVSLQVQLMCRIVHFSSEMAAFIILTWRFFMREHRPLSQPSPSTVPPILHRLINFSLVPHGRKETFALFNDNCKVEPIMGCLPWHFHGAVRSTYLRQMAVPGRHRDEAFSPSHYVCHRSHSLTEKSETIKDDWALNNCEGIIFGKLHWSNNLFSL